MKAAGSILSDIIARYRLAFVAAGMFSGLINLLALTSSIYMLQVYDRVIPAHSIPTLVALTLIVVVLYAAYGVLDMVRTRLMSRVGQSLDRVLRTRVFDLVLKAPLRSRNADGQLPIRDLDTIRGFLTGPGPVAMFDMPWMPLYLGLVFMLHFWLGLLAIAGALILIGLTVLTEFSSREPTRAAVSSATARTAFAEAARRNAEIVAALGMAQRMSDRWSKHSEKHVSDQMSATDAALLYGTISKVVRILLQSAVLGLGAYLVVNGQATGGVMIAASILTSRALAPIEITIANWRAFLSARHSLVRLAEQIPSGSAAAAPMPLPRPKRDLVIDDLWIAAPGENKPIVERAAFKLEAGSGLGVIGPSASGKSTLVRALVGAWRPLRGTIRLDGAAFDQWSPDALGDLIGYLPQDIELFDGTVAENIARFHADAKPEEIIAAARAAGVHGMILGLQNGYETRIGDGGMKLSAGQRQLLALARALYGNPFLVVLDEPNSNLDSEGDAALARAVASVRERGGIVIVVAHRPAALAGLNQILVMGEGKVQAFGPKDEVLRKVLQSPATPSPKPQSPSPPAQPANRPKLMHDGAKEAAEQS